MNPGRASALRFAISLAPALMVVTVSSAQPFGEHEQSGAASKAGQDLSQSVHSNLGCFSCHGPMDMVMRGVQPTAACGRCHQRALDAMRGDAHWNAAEAGKADPPTCVTCHGSHGVRSRDDPSSLINVFNIATQCGNCHASALRDYRDGVHSDVLSLQANPRSATCTSCHTAHGVKDKTTPDSTVARTEVALTCGACHLEASAAYRRSVHGIAAARGEAHAPTCVDCHGNHAIKTTAAPQSPISGRRISGETCGRCHSAVQLMEMHGLPASALTEYRESFHGLQGAFGDRRVANCASCHGYHEILPSWNPTSRISPANLPTTCGQCHVGAKPGFASGGVHHLPRSFGHRLVDIVQTMYRMMIVGIIGLMFLHNGLDWFRRWKDRHGSLRQVLPAAQGPARTYLRFTRNERAQHWTLASSFIVLAVTGFALKFKWSLPWASGQTGATIRSQTHRAAAIIFIVLAVYHLGYLIFTQRGRKTIRDFLPRFNKTANVFCCLASCERLGPPSTSDWRDLMQTIKYNLGLAPARPQLGRFGYAEKMEYLALIWGAIVMIGTGLALWFEVPFLNRFPFWGYELAAVVHYYEAALATLAIIVWHFYFTIFNPDVFPVSKAMITGQLTREQMEHEHALELEDLEEVGQGQERFQEGRTNEDSKEERS